MAEDTEVVSPTQDAPVANPWKFVPLLYILQAIPVTIISDLSAIFYKDLGVSTQSIGVWTSVIALPWSLQFLLGPLVDLSAKKRQWVLMGQFILTICLAAAPFLILPGASAYVVSLIFLAGTAFVSALTNIAMDGYYMLAMTKKAQASFAGVQSAFYRGGGLLCTALVPFLVGTFMQFSPVSIVTSGNLYVAVKSPNEKQTSYLKQGEFHLSQGELVTPEGYKLIDKLGKVITIPGTVNAFVIQNGVVQYDKHTYPLALYQMGKVISNNPDESTARGTPFPTGNPRDTFTGGQAHRSVTAPFAWFVALLCIAIIYGLLMLACRRFLPEAPLDKEPTEAQRGEFRVNLRRTIEILAFYAFAYFAFSAAWRLGANFLSGLNPKLLGGWALKPDVKFLGYETRFSGVVGEFIQLAICLPLAAGLFWDMRRTLRGTDMGEAFASFFRQSKIIPILCFLVFYRFPEAMVRRMAPLFMKDSRGNPAYGLALDNIQIATIKGTIGMIGIIVGGIVGGILAGKIGLKRGFIVIAVLMHLPILLYIYAAIAQPHNLAVVSVVEFVDQFGYGLGYAGYAVYLMSVARRGNHITAHFAIGTGIGGTVIAVAGITAATIQASTNYTTMFVSALLFAIPGLLVLKFLPHDAEESGSAPIQS